MFHKNNSISSARYQAKKYATLGFIASRDSYIQIRQILIERIS